MKIEVLIRLVGLLPRDKEQALTPTELRNLYYRHYPSEESIQGASKSRFIVRYLQEMRDEQLVEVDEAPCDKDGNRDARNDRYHLSDNQALSYFLHGKVAMSLIWTRKMVEPLAEAVGGADIHQMAEGARLSRRERALIDRVRIVPDGIGRGHADVKDAVLRPVVEALEDGCMVRMTYRNAEGRESVQQLTVLGLVAKEGTIYMIAVRGFEDAPRHYALHRVVRAACTAVRAHARPDFQIDAYIEDQHQLAHIRNDEVSPIKLELLVHEDARFHFKERPLSEDQVFDDENPVEGRWYRLTATVPYTVQLAPFLWSHAGWVKVLGPASIRKRVADGVLAAAAHYGGGRTSGLAHEDRTLQAELADQH